MSQNCPWYYRFAWYGAVNCLQIRSTWFVCAFLTAMLPAKTVASCTLWSFEVSKRDFAFSCRWDLAHLKLAHKHIAPNMWPNGPKLCLFYRFDWFAVIKACKFDQLCSFEHFLIRVRCVCWGLGEFRPKIKLEAKICKSEKSGRVDFEQNQFISRKIKFLIFWCRSAPGNLA